MQHILTIKFPDTLHKKIEATAKNSRISRGALVRQALINWFDSPPDLWLSKIKNATQGLQKQKVARPKENWANIYQCTRVPALLSPEDEVLLARKRGL